MSFLQGATWLGFSNMLDSHDGSYDVKTVWAVAVALDNFGFISAYTWRYWFPERIYLPIDLGLVIERNWLFMILSLGEVGGEGGGRVIGAARGVAGRGRRSLTLSLTHQPPAGRGVDQLREQHC